MGRVSLQIRLTPDQETTLRDKVRKFAEQGGRRWADRCNAVLMKADGETIDEIGRKLNRPRNTVQKWLTIWREEGLRGMDPKTYDRGAKKKLDGHVRMLLAKAIDRGPKGLDESYGRRLHQETLGCRIPSRARPETAA